MVTQADIARRAAAFLITNGIERRRPYPGQRYRHGWIPINPGGINVELDPGERQVGNAAIESDTGDLLAAWTDGPAGPRLRLGVGIGDEDRHRWRGRNLGGTVLLDPAAVRQLRDAVEEMDAAATARIPEARAMEADIETLEARRRELNRRQYKGLPKGNIRELDKIEERVEYIDKRLGSIAADIAERQHRLDNETDPKEQRFLAGINGARRGEAAILSRERETLLDRREELAGRGTPLSAEEMAEIRRLRDEIDAAWSRWHEFREEDLASGWIQTPWGALTYRVDLDEDLEPTFGLNIEGSRADDVQLTREKIEALRDLLASILAGESTA